MKTGEWLGSTDEEMFNIGPYETKEQAIEEIPNDAALESGEEFFIGQITVYEPSIDIDTVIENLDEQSAEECGETSEMWVDGFTKEAKEELSNSLNLVLKGWLVHYKYTPEFGSVGETSTHKNTKKED
ncbi:MAG: hypothetical protein KAQ85_00875 [Thermodesulfovibrionia bacterium]|nr:hypothetical protein [Thermodesulfovibrionia bacterium]